jgi:tRNA pseudouridine55 synthase
MAKKDKNSFDGVLNINKPSGMTSHDVIQKVRRAAQMRRVGHAGTLDPLATGVLVVCLGKATRLVEYLVGRPKTYIATVRLGETTDTYDADGEIMATMPVTATEADILTHLQSFRGDIEQIPPMYSAIKRQGQPLYKLARQGIEVEREARPVTIYELELLWCKLPDIGLKVVCSAGTYIRSIAHDLGQNMGCGAHLTTLERTAVGDFRVEEGVDLNALAELAEGVSFETFLSSPDTAVLHFPAFQATAEQTADIQYGRAISRQATDPDGELVRVYSDSNAFIGLLSNEGEFWKPKKILFQ